MFCDNYFLSQVKNIDSIKRYFHTFPFLDSFVFHLIMLFLKGFLVLTLQGLGIFWLPMVGREGRLGGRGQTVIFYDKYDQFSN